MSGLLEGKAGLVTGAAGGIGRGTALELAAEGAAVVVSDLTGARDGGEHTVRLVEAAGGSAAFAPCDVRRLGDQAQLVQQVLDRYGHLDFAVNNAGIALRKPLPEVEEDEYDQVLNVNLKGTFFGMKTQIPPMLERGRGAIVNVSSVAGLVAVNGLGVYAATKHGILGMTRTAAMEFGNRGVRVNAVCPNAIRTPLMDSTPEEFIDMLLAPQAIKRVGEPSEVGAAIAWLCSDKASYVTGVGLAVDGGFLA